MTKLSYVGRPPTDIFQWPVGLAMPSGPFGSWFETMMDVRVPLTVASVYATTVHVLNHFRKTNKEPIGLAKTRLFQWLVVAHNMGLCVYSAWTCYGMSAAIYQSVFEVTKVAVGNTERGTVDAYLRGEGSLVDGTSGNATAGFWRALCDVDVGIWDHGLSYYGFFFYLSKFYEVVDTLIILAKGKQSSLLQTYHHAGAMLSMWAGIRFASPPIWIFVVFNSLIHTIMYFYYTLTTLKLRVPTVVKRSLTTAQICQFVFGGSFALLHMFVYYFDPNTQSYSSCLSDPGQGFALMFNVAYLAPLTYLFVNFWIDSYVRSKQRAADRKAAAKAKQ